MQKLIVYVPRWLRWGLLAFLLTLAASFTAMFFLGMTRTDYGSWIQPSVSIVQIALTGLAYVALLFLTDSGQSPESLQVRADRVMTKLLPQCFERITDTQGNRVRVYVGSPSGVVGRAYDLHTDNTRLRLWVGLNVHRVIVAYFCELPDQISGDEFCTRLLSVFGPTLGGAEAVGYSKPTVQLESIDGYRFASLWLTWNLADQQAGRSHPGGEDFLTHGPIQLFLAQDIALMTQSFLRTAQRQGLKLVTAIEPMPL